MPAMFTVLSEDPDVLAGLGQELIPLGIKSGSVSALPDSRALNMSLGEVAKQLFELVALFQDDAKEWVEALLAIFAFLRKKNAAVTLKGPKGIELSLRGDMTREEMDQLIRRLLRAIADEERT